MPQDQRDARDKGHRDSGVFEWPPAGQASLQRGRGLRVGKRWGHGGTHTFERRSPVFRSRDGSTVLLTGGLIDRGAAMGLSGIENGDIDGNGVIDAGDYYTMDRAFRKIQGGGVGAPAGVSIPEPVGGVALGLAAALAMGRRRGRVQPR